MSANHLVQNRFPSWLFLSVVAFIAVHLTLEHFMGGVSSHHLLNRADLPAISNWWGLLTVPALSIVLSLRVRRYPSAVLWVGLPPTVLKALAGALLYGVIMAMTFSVGAEQVTSAAFLGLFICALVLPVYRIEYILGFVIGMTFVFGGVLPLIVASVVATVSFVSRYCIAKIMGALRKNRSVA